MDVPVARASADLRLLRAAVFTAACVVLSAAGHVLAAGATVPLWAFGAAAALVFSLAVPLAGRERSLPGIAAGLAAGQVGLHVLFAGAQLSEPAAGAPAASGAAPATGGLAALAQRLLCNGASAAPLSEAEARRVLDDAGLGGLAAAQTPSPAQNPFPAPGGGHHAASLLDLTSWPMLLGHLLAALAAGWLLRCGDAALWRLVRLSATAVDGLLRVLRVALAWLRLGTDATGAVVGVPAPGAEDEVPDQPRALRHSVVRRGPPTSPRVYALAA
ncbi:MULTISPECIES: hypothetical protein [unclassified Streptomyces]|uniref:hypothetical protein n=1 Tax=unclassified Streptomyces TaxID=2593676 RepID=UPI0022B624B0|nr:MULTISPECIES: hypothetical protein [unclassified Streptomyces]MCZ7417596.1 hypothetical protein [Streptomyces sp. WMMC897]MCZ7432594.1 hypothetical protein [Streptomyces sp. WMMC1477]